MPEKEQNKNRCFMILIASTLIVCNIFHANGYYDKKDGIIYILIWSNSHDAPFDAIILGQYAFRNCTFNNCFLTDDRGYLRNEIEFEAIMFNVMILKYVTPLPINRSKRQIYIMYGVEPAMFHYIPPVFNGYFNLSFTYKLSSDITLQYIIVKDANNAIIGPNINMNWLTLSEMNEISDYVLQKLQNKSIAAIWIVSNCWTPWRAVYADDLKKELARYGHSLDIYGNCGIQRCSHEKRDECYPLIESNYYFYLSFENSFGEDYVTEKILNGLQHFAVPVVYGGANYSRFMPEGTYLNAGMLEPSQLAQIMNNIIKDKNKYYEFFKWHDHYSYYFTGDNGYQEAVCSLCAILNKRRYQTSILDNISEWWNEEQPIWPLTSTISPWDPRPNALERFITNVLEFLDPPSEDQ